MTTYRVRWEIDVDAESPEDAAQQALEIQRDETSSATCFTIAPWIPWRHTALPPDEDSKWTEVDLEEQE